MLPDWQGVFPAPTTEFELAAGGRIKEVRMRIEAPVRQALATRPALA